MMRKTNTNRLRYLLGIMIFLLMIMLLTAGMAEPENVTVCPGKTVQIRITHRTPSSSANASKYGWTFETVENFTGATPVTTYSLYQPTLCSQYVYESGVLVGVDNFLILEVTGVNEGILSAVITYAGEEIGNYLITVGHSWSEWEITADGNRYRSCSGCGAESVKHITLNETSLEFIRSKDDLTPSVTLLASIDPENAYDPTVTWSSSKPSVATVDDNGLVTIVAPGNTTISCAANDGSGVKATCTITVYNKTLTEIILGETEISFDLTAAGETSPSQKLEYSVGPENAIDQAVIWTSSDDSIASVDKNGTVTPHKAGMATITCEAHDKGGAKAECKVTVTGSAVPPEVKATKVSLNKTSETLTRTGKQPQPTLQLKATVSPDNATSKSVTWKSDKPKVANVDKNGKVTALAAGTATITCKANDGSGKEAKCVITVKDAKVTKITLSKTKATLKVGKTLQLKVKKFAPASPLNDNVKWTTSNKKVATVDKNGKVTAKKAGTVTITCTAQDGSKKKATVKITVK